MCAINISRKKQRGQRRKIAALLKNISEFQAYKNADEIYEHFHVPCSNDFINSLKTSGKVKTIFCKKWIEATENLIEQKPEKLKFCKVVCCISVPEFWDSQIIIFYNEDYYNGFWDRKTAEQTWERITENSISFLRDRGIATHLKEIGYIETISDDDYSRKNVLWFYGDL